MRKFFTLFSLFFILKISFAQSVGGSVGGNTTVCSGTNSGIVTLSGHAGNVVRWQSSTNGGASWTNITNTTANCVYANLTNTTLYRAEVLLAPSPPNVSAYSTPAIITVDVASSGIISSSASVCTGSNAGTLSLSGTFTDVNGWESSIDGGNIWTPIANTTTIQNYSNLTTTTTYRASLANGTCPASNATAATITVSPLSVGGSIAGSDTVCSNANSGTLLLSGQTGNIIRWQYSEDGGASWTNITNTTSIHNFSNIEKTTNYRVVVQSGNCLIANSSPVTIVVHPASVGGNISSSTTVCSGMNNGTLVLSDHTGNIIRWESSTDGGTIWSPIINTTTNYTYNNLATTTSYRALVKSGICDSAYSSTVAITVTSASAGGTISGDDSVCSGSNSGTLTLSGYNGTIIRWQSSTDGGASWSTVSNTTPFLNYSNISACTNYRAVVQNSSCPTANSTEASITVAPMTESGIVSSDATVCSGINNGTLQLTGQTGSTLNWEKSIDNGTTWNVVSNASDTLSYFNLTTKTLFRANIQSGNCPNKKSSAAVITTTSPSIGGTVSGTDTVCSDSNSGTLILSGYTGNIIRWQYSTNGGISWSNISNTTSLENYSNISGTTNYRAVVQNGTCPSDNSSSATIVILPLSVGGSLSPATYSACSGTNSGNVSLSGQTGNVIGWEYSTDGGISWNAIADTSSSRNFQNLITTTKYRVIVQRGQCAAAYSAISTINVSPPSVGGNIIGTDTVCTGTNSGLLTLTGHTGSIQNWEYSINNGVTWSNISNSTVIQNYANLTTTTQYRAVVESGSCIAANSGSAIVMVTPISNGGTVLSNNFVCDSTTTGTLLLTGYTGSILNWEFSIDSGITWNTISNTSNSQTYSSITKETLYRVKVQSGNCPVDSSSEAIIFLAVPVVASYSATVNGATVVFTNTSTGNNSSNLWSFGDNTSSVIRSPAHTYTANGTYVVKLFITDSCGSDSATQSLNITGVGINEPAYDNPEVSVYPNPFAETAILRITNGRIANYEFKMYNIYGKEVSFDVIRNSSLFVIRRGGLASGIYFYKLQSSNEMIATGKIVIE